MQMEAALEVILLSDSQSAEPSVWDTVGGYRALNTLKPETRLDIGFVRELHVHFRILSLGGVGSTLYVHQ